MAAIKIKLDGDKHAFAPGEVISGRAAWHFDEAPSAVELRLMWHTSGKGTTDANVAEVVALAGNGNWGDAPFSITAPAAPWSCDGSLVSICWMLELVAEPNDDLDSAAIVIAPGAKAIRLGALSEYHVEDEGSVDDFADSDVAGAVASWVAAEFSKEHGVDLRKDPLALQRLEEAGKAAAIELATASATTVNLPYITADASGPKHVNYTVTQAAIERFRKENRHDEA